MIYLTKEQLQSLLITHEVLDRVLSSPRAQSLLRNVDDVCSGFMAAFETCCQVVNKLIECGATNSTNSSLSPSADPTRSAALRKEEESRKHKSDRPARKRRPGGQPGHPGRTLKFLEPDEVRYVDPDNIPPGSFYTGKYYRHQVIKRTVTRKVIETRYKIYQDIDGRVLKPAAPRGVHFGRVEYDASVKAAVVELYVGHMVASKRLCSYFAQEGFPISDGTVYNFIAQCAKLLRELGFESRVIAIIKASPVLNVDETFLTFEKHMAFVHCVVAGLYVYLRFHIRRGHEALDEIGILAEYTGVLVHDCYVAYNKYTQCKHALCHAHLRRELKGALDRTNDARTRRWVNTLLNFFSRLNKRVTKSGRLPPNDYNKFLKQYHKIIAEALATEGLPHGEAGTKTQNLVSRLLNRAEEWLLFCIEPGVPYTNNAAERALRPLKLHENVSNCFRSQTAGEDWCLVRSFLYCCHTHDIPWREALEAIFRHELPKGLFPEDEEQSGTVMPGLPAADCSVGAAS